MDPQTAPNQPIQPVISQPSPTQPIQTPPKRNTTPWIIIALLLGATLLTGIAYFVIPQSTQKKNVPTTNPSQTQNPQEKAKWQTYTNNKYQYSFFYPVTWEITDKTVDKKDFELRYIGGPDLGIIKVNVLSPEEESKRQPSFCEKTFKLFRCQVYKLTDNSQVIIERQTTSEDTKADALISHPNGSTMQIQITDSNSNSYYTLAVILNTLSFPNEKRAYGLQICPDTWPTNEISVNYNGVKIPANDIDATWVKANCTYPQQ